MEKDSLHGTTQQRALILPALTPKVSGRRVHFLFSVLQVADIIKELSVLPVPFSPPFIKGIAEWHDRVLPVISLEESLGLPITDPEQARRLVVIRIAATNAEQPTGLGSILRVDPAVRMVSLPLQCTPVTDGWIPQRHLVRCVYDWEEGFLVVVHMEKILSGESDIGSPWAQASLSADYPLPPDGEIRS